MTAERTKPNLSGAQLDYAFPAHLLIEGDGTIVSAGPLYHRLGVDVRTGVSLLERFVLRRPARFRFTPGCFERLAGTLIILEHLGEPTFKLRGEILQQGEDLGLALVSPWIGKLEDMAGLGLEWDVLPVHDPSRDLLMSLQIADRALARQRELATDLRAARDEAENASAAKSVFLANMSHEIRTPLNGIVGTLEILAAADLEAADLDLLEAGRSSARHLLALLEDLLDTAKIEAGHLQVERRPICLIACHREVLQIMGPLAVDHRVVLRSSLPRDLDDCPVLGDEQRIRQVLVNLVGNAIKFSRGASVELRFAGVENEVEWVVEDTGVGMSQDVLDRVLQPFVQADSSTTREYGGTGLGLAITKNLIELMGGKLSLESEVGRGTTVTVTLPLQRIESGPACEENADGTLAGRRILIVDDNPINAKVLERLLSIESCTTQWVENGQLALDAMADSGFDVVLMDLQMPVMGGLEATRRWRAREGDTDSPRLPIVGVSANAFASDREACLDVGMDGFVTKPIRMADLRRAILQCLRA